MQHSSPHSDDHDSLLVAALEDDLLRVRSDVTSSYASEPAQQHHNLHVLLRTADATVDVMAGRSEGVSDAVRLTLGIPATVREVQILLGGESIAEGSFEENGVEDGATIDVVVEEISFEEMVDDIMALNPHIEDREKLTRVAKFNKDGTLKDWDLSWKKLRVLPDSFGGISVAGDLRLSANQLQSLPDSFGGISGVVRWY